MDQRHFGQFCPQLVRGAGPGVGAQPIGQVDGDHPVRPGRSRRSDFLTDHGDAPLQVGERAVQFGGRRSGKQNVGPVGGGGGEQVDGDDRAGTVEGPAGQVMVGNVAQDVGAQQDKDVDSAFGGCPEDAQGVVAGRRREGRPVGERPIPAYFQRGAPGEQAWR